MRQCNQEDDLAIVTLLLRASGSAASSTLLPLIDQAAKKGHIALCDLLFSQTTDRVVTIRKLLEASHHSQD